MESQNNRAVNYLLTVLLPTEAAQEQDKRVQLTDELLQEIKLEETLRSALDKTDVKYAIFDGADIDPSVVPEDTIEVYGRQEAVEAVYQLKKFADGLTKASDVKLRNAINLCLKIVTKAMHTTE